MDFNSARGVYIILDASQIQRDWHLAGLEFQLLRFLIREAGIHAVVPESVFVEVVANQEREWNSAVKQPDKLSAALGRLSGRRGLPAIELAPDDYERRLSDRLEAMSIKRLAYPRVTHEEIVARAASRRPPFDPSGSGYRDTLVWISCLQLARDGERVFLVSQDNDFGNGKGALSTVLTEEVKGSSGAVTLVRNLGSWLMTLIPWSEVDDLKEAVANARDEVLASLFAPWDFFEAPDLTEDELGLPEGAELEEVSYFGSGGAWLERVGHEKNPDGSHSVSYEFPIEFLVRMRLESSVALASGYVGEGDPSSSMVTVETIVSMIGEMSVLFHEAPEGDEPSAEDFPFLYESFHFRNVHPAGSYAGTSPRRPDARWEQATLDFEGFRRPGE
ncbi:hypothetical protein ASD16_15045 [Cellulomonas sp. Root485]|uniref:PIN domain-containing protein n=1 Tax=Cellulomonas sp. Root485 TaxID=1736546 RepID=UPI0006F29ED0|nr:PIN domain-containing protein [Cellulomonas sp. Root485]KQY21973.1 hypothetical protein ASD16_15045 [Cellulomonas sp. Root485]